jgi:hypothetical protein
VNVTKQKYRQKKNNAKKQGIEMCLSLAEFQLLLDEANITAEDIGVLGFQLARYNDEGPYKYGNCRFIWYYENIKEKKTSEANRRASRENIIKAHEVAAIATKGTIVVRDNKDNLFRAPIDDPMVLNGELVPQWKNRKHKEETKKLIGKKSSIHQKGKRNSQYGTCWIYNLEEKRNLKIDREDLENYMSYGWEKGRKMKF